MLKIGDKMLQAFGAWGEKKMYGKTTMGTLRRIIAKVETKNAAGQIL